MINKNIDELSYEDIEKMIEEMTASSSESSTVKQKDDTRAKFEVVKVYVLLNTTKRNKTVFSKVRWGNIERYDLRKWDAEMSIPYKGITLSKEELQKFTDIKKPSSDQSEASAFYNAGSATAKIYDTILDLSTVTIRNIEWHKQINIIDWGYGKKFDIRRWTEKYEKCSKGICLNATDFAKFYNAVLSILREE